MENDISVKSTCLNIYNTEAYYMEAGHTHSPLVLWPQMGLPKQTLIHSIDGIMNDRGKYMSSEISLLQYHSVH